MTEIVRMSWLSRRAATLWPKSISQDHWSQVEGHQKDGQEGMVKNGEMDMPLLGHVFFQKWNNFNEKFVAGPIFPGPNFR